MCGSKSSFSSLSCRPREKLGLFDTAYLKFIRWRITKQNFSCKLDVQFADLVDAVN